MAFLQTTVSLQTLPDSLMRQVQAAPTRVVAFADDVREYVWDHGPRIVGVLAVAAVAWWILRSLTGRLAQMRDDGDTTRDSLTEQRARTAAQLARNAGNTVIAIAALLSIGSALGLEISAFIASAGVIGLAISFGSQSLVRDFVTGFFLQFEQQFVLGDIVRVGTFEGTVEKITLRLVYLRDASGALHIIPNGSITQVTNLSRTWGRAAVDVDVAWDDADRAGEVLREIAESMAGDPAWQQALLATPNLTGIEKFSGGVVTYRIVARVVPARRDDVARELRLRVKRGLDASRVRVTAQPALAPVL